MLRSALGPAVAQWLADPDVAEVMLNPDGRLWLDRLGGGLVPTGRSMSVTDAERVVRLVAHQVGGEAHAERPRVSAELPDGERFEGLLPPVVTAPAFAIRKAAVHALALSDYVATGVMSAGQASVLARALAERRTILVAGPTSSGKTTLLNTLLAEMAGSDERLVILEDVRELRCEGANVLALRAREGSVTMAELVRSALRLRPDRIVVGEVRGGEALDLLKAWGTGHPGGIGALHAGTAAGALLRLEQLAQERAPLAPRRLIAETVELVAVIAGRGGDRRLSELAWLEGLDAAGGYRLTPAVHQLPQAA